MDIKGKVAVITGGASGIGRATALKFAAEGAAGVVVADVAEGPLKDVAAQVGGLAVRCDVSRESEIQNLVREAEKRYGRVDVYFSNAGILGGDVPGSTDDIWDRMWKIHGMAHVWAARAVVEPMIDRGGGYFIVTASAAGLLNIVESAPYGVTKHAAVAYAEWLSIAYGRRGLGVSCLCPQAVRTGMVPDGGGGSAGVDGILSADAVAGEVLATMRAGRFLVLPHPEVLDYLRGKTADYDRWLGGMQKLYQRTHSPR